MQPQKRPQDDFLVMWYSFRGFWVDESISAMFIFFRVAKSISAMFKWYWVIVAAQNCVKAAGGRQNINTYRFKNESATFSKSDAARGIMRPQKRPQDEFWTYKHVICHFGVFFWLAESISAMWFRVMVAAQSRVKAARGRQNCLKISFSKYGPMICLFIGLWVLLWFSNMKIPHNCWLLARKWGRYLKKWQ